MPIQAYFLMVIARSEASLPPHDRSGGSNPVSNGEIAALSEVIRRDSVANCGATIFLLV